LSPLIQKPSHERNINEGTSENAELITNKELTDNV